MISAQKITIIKGRGKIGFVTGRHGANIVRSCSKRFWGSFVKL